MPETNNATLLATAIWNERLAEHAQKHGKTRDYLRFSQNAESIRLRMYKIQKEQPKD